MAPEIIKDHGGDLSWKKADVWSLGCTTLEMTTGEYIHLFVEFTCYLSSCITLHKFVWYDIVLHCLKFYCFAVYCIVLYCTVLYSIVLCCIVLCYIVLYCIV